MQNLLSSILLLIISAGPLYSSVSNEDSRFNVKGETSYSKSNSHNLTTNLNIEYKYSLLEPAHKRWAFFIKGVIIPDYDHFQNEIKMNTFTTFSLEF
jgi:hypothetical protein